MYRIEVKPGALKDLKLIDKQEVKNILDKIESMKNGIDSMNIKKLTNFTPEYRLRVGDYRVLFEVENDLIVIYKIKHCKDVYQ